MSNTFHCDTHGDCEQTFVWIHLTEHAAGLGFNRGEPSEDDPFPDAWCDNCDAEDSPDVRVLCSSCYELSRIRNTRTDVSFEELANLRWKCSSCEEWHYGPCLDFSYDSPVYWTSEDEATNLLTKTFASLMVSIISFAA